MCRWTQDMENMVLLEETVMYKHRLDFIQWIHRQELQGYITSMPDCYPNFILLHHQQIQSKHVFSFLNLFLWNSDVI